MKHVLLGSDGEQPFKIDNSGVSHRHALITIDDRDVWHLEDLNSTNGTFVRDVNGHLRRVANIEITPMTFICLGPNNANGCSFYARQILKPGNFIEEFEYLRTLEKKFEEREKNTDMTANIVRKLIALASLIALTGSFMFSGNSEMKLILLRLGTVISLFSSILYNPSKHRKKIAEERELFSKCPNPKCTHILTSKEINNMQCSHCKCH